MSLLKKCKLYLNYLKELFDYYISVRKCDVVLTATPTHGNLGDHAIALAEQQLMEKCNVKYLELPSNMIKNGHVNWYAAITPNSKRILVSGGGFIGTMWPEEEEKFRSILKAFSDHEVILLPQTVTFDLSDETGKKCLKESQEIYSSHPKLTMFVREKMSLDYMKENFPDVNTVMVPDMVTMLRIPDFECERKGVLYCMRSDIEKNLSQGDMQHINECIDNLLPNEYKLFTDNFADGNVSSAERETEVYKKLKQISSVKIMVTDRLHGMVFAALTGTPCISLGNSNGKVKAVYQWIKALEYIKYIDSVEEFESAFMQLDFTKQYKYDYNLVSEAFQPLRDKLSCI